MSLSEGMIAVNAQEHRFSETSWSKRTESDSSGVIVACGWKQGVHVKLMTFNDLQI